MPAGDVDSAEVVSFNFINGEQLCLRGEGRSVYRRDQQADEGNNAFHEYMCVVVEDYTHVNAPRIQIREKNDFFADKK